MTSNKERLRSPDWPTLVQDLGALGVEAIKLREYIPPGDLERVISEARALSLPVYGHTWTGPPPKPYSREAIRAGVAGLSHLAGFAPMSIVDWGRVAPMPDPEAGSAFWPWRKGLWLYTDATEMQRVINEMVTAGVWLEPLLVTERHFGGAVPVPESFGYLAPVPSLRDMFRMARGWIRKGEAESERTVYAASYDRMKTFVRRFHDSGGRLIAGSDGGPLWFYEELNLLLESGIGREAVLRAATSDAALVLRRQHEIGTIEEGKMADLAIFDREPFVASVSEDFGPPWRVMKGGYVHDPATILGHERRRVFVWGTVFSLVALSCVALALFVLTRRRKLVSRA